MRDEQKVTIVGADWETGRLLCRDHVGNEFEANGLLRRSTGFPVEGERWVLSRVGGEWVPDFQIGAPQIATIDGSRDGMHSIEEQVLDAVVGHGLVLDSTDQREPGDLEDPPPDWPPPGDPEMPEPPPDEPVEEPDQQEPPKDEGPKDPPGGGGGKKDPLWQPLFLGTMNIPFYMGDKAAERNLVKFSKTKVQVFGTQEFWPDTREPMIDRMRDRGWGVWRPSDPPHADACTIFWRQADFEVLDKGAVRISPPLAGQAPPRHLVWVKLRDKGTGQPFYFMDTHFDALVNIGNNPARVYQQTAAVADRMRSFGQHAPVFTAGDFNRNWREDSRVRNPQFPYAAFKRARTWANWDLIGRPDRFGTHGMSLIDTIWITRPAEHRVRPKANHILTGYHGDHRPVIVKVELRDRTRRRGRRNG